MRPTLKNGTWLGASTAAIIIAGTVTALAQTAATPTPQGCTGKTGTDMTQCQNELSNQQNDATVGNGPNAQDPAKSNGIGGNNNVGGDASTGNANGATGTNGGNGSNPAAGSGNQNQGGATGTNGGNGSNSGAGSGDQNGGGSTGN